MKTSSHPSPQIRPISAEFRPNFCPQYYEDGLFTPELSLVPPFRCPLNEYSYVFGYHAGTALLSWVCVRYIQDPVASYMRQWRGK